MFHTFFIHPVKYLQNFENCQTLSIQLHISFSQLLPLLITTPICQLLLLFINHSVFQLDEEDENGWCRGLLNGVEGLYPGSYVQLMK